LLNINDLFITRRDWNECCSGLLGLIYTMSKYSKLTFPSLNLHAPFDLKSSFVSKVFHLLDIRKNFKLNQIKNNNIYKLNEKTEIEIIDLKHKNESVYSYLITIRISNRYNRKILILDLPIRDYLSILQKNINANIDLIVHMSPSDLVNNLEYKKTIETITDSKTKHVYLNEKTSNLISKEIYLNQLLLNELDNDIFPVLPFSQQNQDIFINGKTSMMINLETNLLQNSGFYRWHELSPKEILIKKYPNYKIFLSKFKSNEDDRVISNLKYPEIIFLGTSSSSPSLLRNTSAILVKLDPNKSILMDCGEDTLGQFIRFYGESNYLNELMRIKAVYVSHFHSDHHLGLYSLINKRKEAFDLFGLKNEKLFFLYPSNLETFLVNFQSAFNDISSDLNMIDNDYLMEKFKIENESLKTNLNLEHIETVPVIHAPKSTGLIFKMINGIKIVYSGDCKPTKSLIEKGQNCDILIHEATYDDYNKAEANKYLHSTISQAIHVGHQMRAKHIILTHFHLNLAKNTRLLFENFNDNVVIAQDNMKINMNSFNLLKKLKKGIEFLNPNDNFLIRRNF
jgi:ribonuclease Z